MTHTERDARTDLDQWIEHARLKADRNKRRARVASTTVIAASAAIPVALTVLPEGAAANGAASLLAALVLVTTSLAQIEHPHERWIFFRRYQRLFEAERTRYEYHLPPYDDQESAASELAARTVELQLELHQTWEGVVPQSAEIGTLRSPLASQQLVRQPPGNES